MVRIAEDLRSIARQFFLVSLAQFLRARFDAVAAGRQKRDRSIVDLCGGRAAILPAVVAEDRYISNGEYRLYGAMCGRAKANGSLEFCIVSFAKRIGMSIRTVQRWRVGLERKGLIIQLSDGDKSVARFRVIRRPDQRDAARAENSPKIAQRRARKTPRATTMSHARCDTGAAHNMKNQHDPLKLPRSLTRLSEVSLKREEPKAEPARLEQSERDKNRLRDLKLEIRNLIGFKAYIRWEGRLRGAIPERIIACETFLDEYQQDSQLPDQP